MLSNIVKDVNRLHQDLFAALDLGSNSFQLLLVKASGSSWELVTERREKVQLAAGIDDNGCLTAETRRRALACLESFAAVLARVPLTNIKAVGTQALRSAEDATLFVHQAAEILGIEVQILSGKEEAELIFRGAVQALPRLDNSVAANDSGSGNSAGSEPTNLVIDIGGGSCEFAIGHQHSRPLCDSVALGVVPYSQNYFPAAQIDAHVFQQAVESVRRQLKGLNPKIMHYPKPRVIGCSGTLLGIESVLVEQGLSAKGIGIKGLEQLIHRLTSAALPVTKLQGLEPDRRDIFAAGVAILYGIMQSLSIDTVSTVDYALKEGVVSSVLAARKAQRSYAS